MTRWMFLMAFIFLLLGSGTCEVTKIYTSQDVYFSLQSEKVFYNDTLLRCEVNVTGENNNSIVYPGEFVAMVQFNISGLKIGEDDIGILVLKADSVKGDDNGGMVAVVPVASDWDENSEFLDLAVNLLPLWKSMKKNELAGQIGTDSDGDKIFAYDVSGKLKEIKEDRISFFLEAVSNSTYRADFKSRESGEGPYLMVIPYPSVLKINLTQNLTLNQSQNLTLNQSQNLTLNQSQNLTLNQTQSLTSNQTLNQSIKQEPENASNDSTTIGNKTASTPDATVIHEEEMEPSNIRKQGEVRALSLISSLSAL
jgi:hypothetical protein